MPLSVDPPVKVAGFSLVMYAGLLKPHLCKRTFICLRSPHLKIQPTADA